MCKINYICSGCINPYPYTYYKNNCGCNGKPDLLSYTCNNCENRPFEYAKYNKNNKTKKKESCIIN